MASDASHEEGVPRSVPVRVAHELLQAGHRYLDVRCQFEKIFGSLSYKFGLYLDLVEVKLSQMILQDRRRVQCRSSAGGYKHSLHVQGWVR